MVRYSYNTLMSNKQLTCKCSKFLMMSVLVCKIRLKKLCVHQVSVISWKAGTRVLHQSILTDHVKPMCAVKTNMPKILSEKIGPRRLCRVLFYIWILFSVWMVLLLFQINVSGSELDVITQPTWMICECIDVGDSCWRECKQDVY